MSFFCYFFVIFMLFFCYFFAFSMSFFCYLPLLVSSLASNWGRAQKPSSTDLDLEDAQHGEKFSKRAAEYLIKLAGLPTTYPIVVK